MSFIAALRSALRALSANALRSVLTMLGIIIGVAAVITMIAVGQGATERVQEQMKGLGSNIMLVLPGGVSQAGVRLGAQTRQRLTEEDAQAIAFDIPAVQVAAPTSRTSGQLVYGNTNWGTSIIGFGSYHYRYASGREGDAAVVGFSPRVGKLSLYLNDGTDRHAEALGRLGPHSVTKACLHLKRLAGVDVDVLAEILQASYENTRETHA